MALLKNTVAQAIRNILSFIPKRNIRSMDIQRNQNLIFVPMFHYKDSQGNKNVKVDFKNVVKSNINI